MSEGNYSQRTVICGGLPKTTSADTSTKLLNVLKKSVFGKYAVEHVDMPQLENGGNQGMVFARFATVDEALAFSLACDGSKIDTKHFMRCCRVCDFEYVCDEEIKPAVTDSACVPHDRSQLNSWMDDGKGLEQLVVRYAGETEVLAWDPLEGGLVPICTGEAQKAQDKCWCHWRVNWSSKGSYLVTHHKPGLMLWGDSDFGNGTPKCRMPFNNASHSLFAPNEAYVLVWDEQFAGASLGEQVVVFHVLSGKRLGALPAPFYNSERPPTLEFSFQWSPDGSMIACMQGDGKEIMVYELPSLNVVKNPTTEKKLKLQFDGLSHFCWSPAFNHMAVWQKEHSNNPARVQLLEIPSRRELASRSRTGCEAKMIFHSEGKYLCLVLNKALKGNRRKSCNLEIFRITEKNCPVENLELKDHIKGFFFEPRGDRFCVITESDAGAARLRLYSLAGGACSEVHVMDMINNNTAFNHISWAPEGQFMVVVALNGNAGDILFLQATPENRLEVLHKDEHFKVNGVSWDPSSRFVMTSVCSSFGAEQDFGLQDDAGYCIWTFQGRLMVRQKNEQLNQVAWRPHPQSLLSTEERGTVRKDFKKYAKQYEAADEDTRERVRLDAKKQKDGEISAFLAQIDECRQYWNEKYPDWPTNESITNQLWVEMEVEVEDK